MCLYTYFYLSGIFFFPAVNMFKVNICIQTNAKRILSLYNIVCDRCETYIYIYIHRGRQNGNQLYTSICIRICRTNIMNIYGNLSFNLLFIHLFTCFFFFFFHFLQNSALQREFSQDRKDIRLLVQVRTAPYRWKCSFALNECVHNAIYICI